MSEFPKEDDHQNEVNRREFLEETGATVGGVIVVPGIAELLASQDRSDDTAAEMSEREHKKQETRKAMHARKEFQKDRMQWIQERHATLVVSDPKKVCYCVGCIDEGDDLQLSLPEEFARELPENFDTISIPGSGVTYAKLDKDIKSLRLHVEGVTSHHECGACKGVDATAEYVAKKLAGPDELNVPYIGMVHHLHRPEFHIALGAHVRYTPKIRNIRFAEDAPRYFDISQFAIKDRKARVANMALALKIAFHKSMGFHDLFTEENAPFELCAYYDPKDLYFTKALITEEMDEAIAAADIEPELKQELLKRNLIQKHLIPVSRE